MEIHKRRVTVLYFGNACFNILIFNLHLIVRMLIGYLWKLASFKWQLLGTDGTHHVSIVLYYFNISVLLRSVVFFILYYLTVTVIYTIYTPFIQFNFIDVNLALLNCYWCKLASRKIIKEVLFLKLFIINYY